MGHRSGRNQEGDTMESKGGKAPSQLLVRKGP